VIIFKKEIKGYLIRYLFVSLHIYLTMPNICILKGGIKINVYANDHVPPHIHAIYAEHEVLIEIEKQKILEGMLPKNHLHTVKDYVNKEKVDLLEFFFYLNPQINRK